MRILWRGHSRILLKRRDKKMFQFRHISAGLLAGVTYILGGSVWATTCDDFGATAFACMIEKNSKIVSVCVNQTGVMRYQYGRAFDAPEIELYAHRLDAFDGFFNHGVGGYIWHEATFQNAGYDYVVGFSVDRNDENHPISGYVQVLKGENAVANLACREDTIFNNMDILY